MMKLNREEYNIVSFWSGDMENWNKNIQIMELLTEEQKSKINEIIKNKEE